jgi:hypothetical protein
MKLTALILVCVFSLSTYAQVNVPEDAEVIISREIEEGSSIKISEVKQLADSLGAENTCLDEYLKRRRNLIIRLAASPATVVAGTYAAAIGLGFAGVGVATVVGADELAGVVLGLFVGFTGGGVATLTDTGLVIAQLVEMDRLTKALAEQHLGAPGKNSSKIYAQYLKKNQAPLEQEVFFKKLLELDDSGKLCDGSLVKKPALGSGRALRFKVARVKHLRSLTP